LSFVDFHRIGNGKQLSRTSLFRFAERAISAWWQC